MFQAKKVNQVLRQLNLDSFIEEVATYDKVRIVGLMTMAPLTENQDEIRSVFRTLRELRDGVSAKNLPHAPCTQLSMGMSNDYIIAIEEGATHVRIGTALVGAESEGRRMSIKNKFEKWFYLDDEEDEVQEKPNRAVKSNDRLCKSNRAE